MLARSIESLPRRSGLSYEPKWDGHRCLVFARPDASFLQARRGSGLGRAFPEVARAAGELAAREDVVLDGELVVLAPDEAVLDFGALQARARRTGAGAERAARKQPAHVIVFDILELDGHATMRLPYRERRSLLEDLFARLGLLAPWTLCPATTDPETAAEWLHPAWARIGCEGCVIKPLSAPYRPGERGTWTKLRSRETAEAVTGAVTGPLTAPTTLLLGRYNTSGTLRLVARTNPLSAAPWPARSERSSHRARPGIRGSTHASPRGGSPTRSSTTGASPRSWSSSSPATPPWTWGASVTRCALCGPGWRCPPATRPSSALRPGTELYRAVLRRLPGGYR
ncbi:ATP-dependent DNA ligase [Streptomyces iconiensis]|uniref:ATP-dependent DNA ligase n=1 Tax=Streptomyces iconiensis TaxID=1384038 RepID=UPI00321A1ED6